MLPSNTRILILKWTIPSVTLGNAQIFEYEDTDPEVSVIFSCLDVGEYRVNVTNYGDENVIGSDDAIVFNVTELPGTITASDMTRGYNSGMDFMATG